MKLFLPVRESLFTKLWLCYLKGFSKIVIEFWQFILPNEWGFFLVKCQSFVAKTLLRKCCLVKSETFDAKYQITFQLLPELFYKYVLVFQVKITVCDIFVYRKNSKKKNVEALPGVKEYLEQRPVPVDIGTKPMLKAKL